MSDKVWKAFERQVARFFGTERTPGSGSAGTFVAKSGNVVRTNSDSLHETLYIEAKRDKKNQIIKCDEASASRRYTGSP